MRARVARIAAIAACFLIAAALGGCAQRVESATMQYPDSPESVTKRYFEALGSGDTKTARALELTHQTAATQYDESELRGLKNLEVGDAVAVDASSSAATREFSAVVIVPVTFTRVRKSSIGDPPGEDARFAQLCLKPGSSRWRVLYYGTGP